MQDPRTLLPLATVPGRLLPAFNSVQSCVMHWIGTVSKVAPNLRETEKVGILGDAAFYVCDLNSTIKRCLLIGDIRDLVVKEDEDTIGFRMTNKTEHDVVLRFQSRDFAFLLGALKRIYWVHMGVDLVITTVGPGAPVHPHMTLAKPSDWVLKVEPLRPRRYLERLMADQSHAYERHVEEVHDEFVRIKNELRHALESQRNQQYDRMVKQCGLYVQRLAEKDEYVSVLRTVLESVKPHVMDTASNKSIERVLAVTDPSFVPHDQSRLSALVSSGTSGAQPEDAAGADDRDEKPAECENCKQLQALLEAHPSADKRRVLGAEEVARAAQRELELAQSAAQPLREQISTLQVAITKADAVLLDQRLSLQDRVRGASAHTTPHALVAASSSKQAQMKEAAGKPLLPQMNIPPAADVSTLTQEVLALRSVLRDASAQHMAEMNRLRKEFDEYDEAMVAAVRIALESSGVAVTAGSARTTAESLVATERQRVLRLLKQDRGTDSRQRASASPQRSGSLTAGPGLAGRSGPGSAASGGPGGGAASSQGGAWTPSRGPDSSPPRSGASRSADPGVGNSPLFARPSLLQSSAAGYTSNLSDVTDATPYRVTSSSAGTAGGQGVYSAGGSVIPSAGTGFRSPGSAGPGRAGAASPSVQSARQVTFQSGDASTFTPGRASATRWN